MGLGAYKRHAFAVRFLHIAVFVLQVAEKGITQTERVYILQDRAQTYLQHGRKIVIRVGYLNAKRRRSGQTLIRAVKNSMSGKLPGG
jgi:hypothetical protein